MDGKDDKFEVYQDKRGEWRWRRVAASNGKIVGASCEGYKSRGVCEKNMSRGPVPTDKWEFYKDKRGEFRWRRIAQNGKVVGAATEGYSSKGAAEANAQRQGYQPPE